jgi:hypothetical protein
MGTIGICHKSPYWSPKQPRLRPELHSREGEVIHLSFRLWQTKALWFPPAEPISQLKILLSDLSLGIPCHVKVSVMRKV